MEIITRAAAGLPPRPSSLSRRTRPWAGKTWHHTGGNYTTWRAIYDWQTDGRPEADELIDIGYSYGIANGRVTELRGYDWRPAGDHENSRVQICFMGKWDSKLPPAADLAAALELDRYLDERAGLRLQNVAHRDVWSGGQYDTDCPGNALYAWVRANLATAGGEDDEMQLSDKIPYVKGPEASYSQDATTVATLMGQTLYYVLATRNKMAANEAADAARDEAVLALLRGAAGGSVDVLPVLERINAVRDEVLARLEAKFTALELERDELQARLAEALSSSGS